ncbi:MAG: MFS transporter [Bacteroidota bacterium]
MSKTTSQHSFPAACPTGRWTLAATIIASSMAFIDSTALNVILPSLQSDLGANASDLFWVLNSYLLMLAALIIVGGSLGDSLGRVRVFQVGIIIFTIGSLLCGFSQDITQLIIFRTLQGIGGAFMIPGSLAIISATFSKEEKGKAIGTWSSVTTIVTICGPVLGGALAGIGLWRLIFFINIPLGIAALLVSQWKVPESKDPNATRVDWLGAILLAVSLMALNFGFLEMPEWTFWHPYVFASISVGVVLFFVFLWVESTRPWAMVPLRLFRNRAFSGINLLSFFLYAALGGVMLFLSLNLIQIQGFTELQAGLTFLPFSLLMVVVAPIAGRLTDRYGARNFLVVGPTLTGIGFLMLANVGMTGGPGDYWTTFFPGFMVFALGMSITVVPLTTGVMSAVGDNQSGVASGVNNSVTRLANSFMNALLGVLAISLFLSYVSGRAAELDLTGAQVLMVLEEGRKLGEATAPEGLSQADQTEISVIYRDGFINVYRLVALFSASLAFLSAIIAVFTVRTKRSDPAG